MRSDIKNQGFFLVMVLVIVMMLGLFSLIVWNIIKIDYDFIENQNLWSYVKQLQTNDTNIAFAYHTFTNTNGYGKDFLSCSGGVLQAHFSEIPTCDGEIVFAPDGIDDKGDNDDFRASFYTGSVGGVLMEGSDLYDDDDRARLTQYFLVPPLSRKTIFFSNDAFINTTSLNPNNTSWYPNTPKTPGDISTLSLSLTANQLGGKLEVSTFDKNSARSGKDLMLISQKSGEIQSLSGMILESGDIGNGLPFFFQIHEFDYGVVVENTSSGSMLALSLSASDELGHPVYLVALDDRDGFEGRSLLLQELWKNYYGYVLYSNQ